MDAKTKLLRDAGVLSIATAVALGTAGVASAKRPNPHNFKRPMPHNFVHPAPRAT